MTCSNRLDTADLSSQVCVAFDFDNVFVAEYKSPILVPPGYLTRWDVPATWVEAEKMFPIIDQRFSEWKNAK